MIKKITAFFIVLIQLLMSCAVVAFAENSDITVYHISTTGKKNGDGSEQNPYDSIETVQNVIRNLKSMDSDVVVKIHGGKYYRDKTIEFTSVDSGRNGHRVIYEAAGDGDVIFLGSKEIDFSKFKPITDPDTLSKLADGMQECVGYIDLKQFGFTSDMVDFISNTQKAVYEYPSILGVYLNGEKQNLAKYPNVGWLKIQSIVKEGGRYPNYSQAGNGDIIEIPNLANLEKWAKAEDAQVQGYISAEYARDWRQVGEINTNDHTLRFAKYSMGTPRKGGRFQILNLLEELDMPGEWYIDKRNCYFYYYPSHGLRKGEDSLTIAALNSEFITMKGVSNLTIDGVKFHENAANGITMDGNCENIIIKSCEFKNIGGVGTIVNGKNNLISGCKYLMTSKRGVTLNGGDGTTLTHANNEVSNSLFYKTGMEGGGNSDGAVYIGGCGNKCKYNMMHNIENYPISYYSQECEITNNEIFNSIRNQADAAVIYTGRSFLYQGNKIQYNFIHDNVMFDYTSGLGSHAIGFDDWSSGCDVSWNIVYMGKKTGTVSGASPGSRDTRLTYNTNICSTSGNVYSYRDVPNVFSGTGSWGTTLKQLFNNSQKFDTSFPEWSSKYSSYDKIMEDIKKDNDYILPRNQYLVGNLAVDCVKNSSYPEFLYEAEYNNTIKDNVAVDDYDIFVDPENMDYRVKMSAIEKYGISDKILNENNWDMDRMGIQEEVLKLEKPTKPFYKIYPRNGAENVQRNDAIIAWESAQDADEYSYQVATDPEMKNIVAEGRTMNTIVKIEGLENGKSYYWNVSAKNISRKFSNEWKSSETPYLMTIATYDNIIKTELKNVIKKAEEKCSEIEVSEMPVLGEYKPEATDAYKEEIDRAKAEYSKSFNSQENIDEAAKRLDSFSKDLDGYRYQGYKNLEFTSADSLAVQNGSAAVSYSDGVCSVAPLNAGTDAHVSYNGEISQSEAVYRFRMKLNGIKDGYSMISVRNTSPHSKCYATQAYTIVLKADAIEFQKGAKVKETAPNDINKGPITTNEWHDWEITAADVPGGVEYMLKIDGEEIIHHFDNSEALHQGGTLVINPWKDMTFELAAPTEIKEGFYEPDPEFFKEKNFIIKDNEDPALVTDGNFATGTIKGYNDKAVLISDGKAANAVWNAWYDVGYYKISYYHTPVEKGDDNAKITIKSGGGISGDTEYKIPVDFTRGEKGWVDLGTILIMGIDGKRGEMKFTVSSEGDGVIPVSAIKIEPSTEQLKEITGFVYEKNSNVLLLKPDINKAYKNMMELELAKAPVIENGRTLVPLRFVSEAFNCDVEWVQEEKKAVIIKKDTKIEFSIDSSEYTVNGQKFTVDQPAVLCDDTTLVPIRAISDALGKQCHWDEATKLIFICDKFGLADNDEAAYNACSKLFE
ncbi:MAG: stalk domain-containing protein [Clostridia bacterium]|nr:stalk domain-containing protein [Clostridia bacterium]